MATDPAKSPRASPTPAVGRNRQETRPEGPHFEPVALYRRLSIFPFMPTARVFPQETERFDLDLPQDLKTAFRTHR